MSEIKINSLDAATIERLKSYYANIYDELISCSPGNCILPIEYTEYAERLLNFEIRDDDIFIHSWPKNGTTWTQELVWNLMNYENIDDVKKIALDQRAPFLEGDMIVDMSENSWADDRLVKRADEMMMSKFRAMKSPRIFKTHLPYCLLPPNLLEKCKVVSCLRNPKDTLVSYYHYENLWRHDGSLGDFAAYFDLFMDNLVLYSPYWDSVLENWKNKDHPNMCLLFFEDMKRDLAGNIRKAAEFLHKDINDSMVDDLVGRLSFKKLKELSEIKGKEEGFDTIPQVYRKGEIGDWKNHFTKEMNDRMDKVIAEKFKGTGLNFIYD